MSPCFHPSFSFCLASLSFPSSSLSFMFYTFQQRVSVEPVDAAHMLLAMSNSPRRSKLPAIPVSHPAFTLGRTTCTCPLRVLSRSAALGLLIRPHLHLPHPHGLSCLGHMMLMPNCPHRPQRTRPREYADNQISRLLLSVPLPFCADVIGFPGIFLSARCGTCTCTVLFARARQTLRRTHLKPA